MRVLIFEDNLMWSARLVQSLRALGHDAVVHTTMPEDGEGAGVAIVNLGSKAIEPTLLVPKLKALGIPTIGHAGHKEKDLLELGKKAGCDLLVSNSQLTYKIEQVLAQATGS